MTGSVSDSRFKLVQQPSQAPSKDYVTGTTVDPKGFIDTQHTVFPRELKGTGRVYLAVETVREMAREAGLFDELTQAVADAANKGYEKGYSDGLRDNPDLPELRELVARLGHLGSLLPDPNASSEGSGTDGAVVGGNRGKSEAVGQDGNTPFD